jgi:translation initiation factor 2 gamma subunit (eIF-2gamma)
MRGCGWLKQNIIMETIAIIGHVDRGKTTLTAAIKSVLEQKHSVYQDAFEEVIEYKNPYAFLNEKPTPSKSRLNKCKKGLHEFQETNHDIVQENMFVKKWACMHCGTLMHER